MPAGFQTFNETGNVQIDANFKNMEFRSKGTFSIAPTNAPNGGGVTSTYTVRFTGQAPILAIVCSSYCYVGTYIEGAETLFVIVNAENATITGEYFIFDVADNTQSSNSGLQVFNELGQLVFDANKRYMKVLDYYEAVGVTQVQTRSYGGKKIAWVMTDYGYTWSVLGPPNDPGSTTYRMIINMTDCATTSNSTMQVYRRTMYVNTRAPYRPEYQGKTEGPSRWLVLDVTNL